MDWFDLLDKAWFNRLGMILVFISFWLVAPEILGEERLRRWTERTVGGLFNVAGLVSAIVVGLWLVSCGALFWFIIRSRAEDTENAVNQLSQYVYGFACLAGFGIPIIGIAFALVEDSFLLRLANNATLRQRFLIAGAFFFVFGSLLQFIATF